MTVRVLIVEAHPALRATLGAVLIGEPELCVVGEFGTLREAFAQGPTLQPDVVLIDLGLPDLLGFDSLRGLRAALPAAQFLLLTDSADPALARDALLAGAAGCVAGADAAATLAPAIQSVAHGGAYIPRGMVRPLLAGGRAPVAASACPSCPLTPREADILRLIGQGYTNRQAATALGLSARTVESHRERMIARLGLRGRAALVRYALEWGLVEPPRPAAQDDGRRVP